MNIYYYYFWKLYVLKKILYKIFGLNSWLFFLLSTHTFGYLYTLSFVLIKGMQIIKISKVKNIFILLQTLKTAFEINLLIVCYKKEAIANFNN